MSVRTLVKSFVWESYNVQKAKEFMEKYEKERNKREDLARAAKLDEKERDELVRLRSEKASRARKAKAQKRKAKSKSGKRTRGRK